MSFGFIGNSPEQKYNSNKGVFSMEEIQELVDNHDWAGRAGLSIDLHVIGAGAAGAADAQGGGAGGGFAGGTLTFYKQMDIIVGSKGNASNQPGGASYVFFNDGDEHLRGPGGGDRTGSNHFVNSNSSTGVGGNVQLNGGHGSNSGGGSGNTSGNFGAPGGGGGNTHGGGTGNGLAGNGGAGSNHNANSNNSGVNAGFAGQAPGGGGGGGSGYYGAGGAGADGGVIAIYTSEYQQLTGGDTVNSSGSGSNTIWTHTFNTSGQLDWA
tara:strand:+ start:1760 stop:2557 length:798 start_codon:yes stop_codon:yes gene_type:complete